MAKDYINDFHLPEYEFLSNFYIFPILYGGRIYPSSEHAYQAAKLVKMEDREAVRLADTPGKAKRLGQKFECRSDWNHIKIEVMEDILRIKFATDLKPQLLATHPKILVEGNTRGDTFWGVYNNSGQNWLGRLLMKIRDERN